MKHPIKQLRIFIAFASDCDAERRAIHRICQSDPTIKKLRLTLGISLDCVDFMDVCSDAGRPQSLINLAAERWKPDWFIFLFWQRLGRDAGLGMTGMEEEWSRAIELNRKGSGHPRVSLYFNKAEGDAFDAGPTQVEALERFRTTIFEQHQALATFFNGTRKFREQLRADLSCRLVEVARGVDSLDLDQEFKDSSKGLLQWPRTLGVGDEIQRPELPALLDKVRTAESSTTLILGGPGSGKSALLAGLGHECLKEGFSVLAVKADMLGKGIRTPEDLRQWLQLTLNTNDAVKKLAEKKPVVVLVDQLDAVSELVDRQSERLNVLLNLIHGLSEHQRVHIIASSRAFECQHDIRLNSLNADRIDLALPPWDKISPILAKAGYDPAVIGDSTRDLLRSPWCLKVFLDVAKPGMVFSTFQSLLEEVWIQRVLAGEEMKERVELLEYLAKKMSADETLWVPSSVADMWPKALQGLAREDILSRGPDGNTIGFRHQTFYDYTLARAFAKGALSLSGHVRRRQNGLFVRPTLLNGLQHLRGTATPEYHRQIRTLFGRGIRLHIRSLLTEFLGAQKDPDDIEFSFLGSLLKSEKEGPRVLASMAGSPGWFKRMSNVPVFLRWMRKPHDTALHCLNLLCLATQFDAGRVLDLLERYWFPKKRYDDLTLRVLSSLSVWTDSAVALASPILERRADGSASFLVDKAAESAPELASILLRAALDGRLRQARAVAAKLRKKIPLSAEEKLVAGSALEGTRKSLIRLIEKEEDWYNLDTVAEAVPKVFLDHIWAWFLKVISMIAHKEHEFVIGYRDDPATYNEFEGELPQGPIVKALLVAVTRLAQQAPDQFIEFARTSRNSDLLIVHRLLARGFLILFPQRPSAALEYLLGDPRRLEIGDHEDRHRESKALIATLSSCLADEDMKFLEEAVINFKQYKKIMPGWTPQERFERTIWTRGHRLRLLRAFSLERMTEAARALRDQEERALPGVPDYDSRGEGGWVGARMTAEEMGKASDENLLNLIKALPDQTESSNPRRQWPRDFSRAGGARQLANELRELAKKAPERVLPLLDNFSPGEQETYAGAALEGLAETDVPTSRLIANIAGLNEKGFSSGSFREGAARALKIRAGREKGLPQNALAMLEDWLRLHREPGLAQYREGQKEEDVEKGREILFGHSPSWILPHGRGPIIEAIAEGYLRQEPPNYVGWTNVIKDRLKLEAHPAIWVMTLMRMPSLFNWDKGQATTLFDAVIQKVPAVLEYDFALYSIANIVRLCQPKTTAQGWINLFSARRSKFSQQAYGEFLFLYHCRYNDSWSRDRITKLLRAKKRKRTLLGLAHGASHLWKYANCRARATKVLEALASARDPLLVRAVGNLFRLTREEFEVGPQMHRLILRIAQNRRAILASVEDLLEILAPLTAREPKLVLRICHSFLKVGRDGIRRYGGWSVPENLTNIALTLHRQRKYRAAGLKLFESLLEMNLGEAKAALEVLDRNPVQKVVPYWPRRSRRRRVAAPKA
jgi:hypothetical protein